MVEKKERKQLSGGAKMKASGKKAILLGVTPEQFDKIKLAASLEMRARYAVRDVLHRQGGGRRDRKSQGRGGRVARSSRRE